MIIIYTDEGLPTDVYAIADIVVKDGIVVKSRTGNPPWLTKVKTPINPNPVSL
jgi:hypothetical protein